MSSQSSMWTKQSTPLILKKNEIFNSNEEIFLIKSLSSLIEEIIQKNSSRKIKSKQSSFYCKDSTFREMSVFPFIYNIYTYLNLNFSTILLSLISIKRFLMRTKDELTKRNFYKLFITSCLLNSKQNEECTYNSEIFALFGNININELHSLEKEFFEEIDYKLYVNDEVYQRYYELIKKRHVKINEIKNFNYL